MTDQRIGFTGRGEQIVVEVPRMDTSPKPPLTDTQRAHIRSLIAREHVGDESELSALARVIHKTEMDRVRLAGVLTSDGISIAALAEKRLTNLRRYQREIEGDE